jgi:NADH-quinone oxidoreductase subunit J
MSAIAPILVYLFAAIAIASAVRAMTHPKPVYCVLYFVLTVLAVGAELVLAWATFLAIALIVIYAGAILVLFVFVLMLAGGAADSPGDSDPDADVRTRPAWLAVLLAGALVGGLIVAAFNIAPETGGAEPAAGPAAIGLELFNHHLLALELAGVLLLMAVVAAIALVQRKVVSTAADGLTSPAADDSEGKEGSPHG